MCKLQISKHHPPHAYKHLYFGAVSSYYIFLIHQNQQNWWSECSRVWISLSKHEHQSMGLPQIRNGDLFSPSHNGREKMSDKFPGERAHVVQMHHKTQADSCRLSCSWPWTRPKAKTVRFSVWFIHQAAQARVLLTPGTLLSVNSLWAISGTSPKVKSVI